MSFKVGSGASLQIGKESVFGTGVAPTHPVDFTSESLVQSTDKASPDTLMASKTARARDIMGHSVDGSISFLLRPEMAGLIFKAVMGGTDTMTTSGSHKKHSIVLADVAADLPSLTVVVDRKTEVVKYAGVTVSSLKVDAAAGDYVKCDASLVGVKEESGASLTSNLSFSVPAYRCTSATMTFGDQTLDVSSASFTIDNALEEAPKTYGSGLYKGQPQHGQRSVSISFEIPKSSATDAIATNYGRTETTAAVVLTFASSSSDYTFKASFPNVNITSANKGNVSGTGILTASFEGEALSIGSTEPMTVEIIDDAATAF